MNPQDILDRIKQQAGNLLPQAEATVRNFLAQSQNFNPMESAVKSAFPITQLPERIKTGLTDLADQQAALKEIAQRRSVTPELFARATPMIMGMSFGAGEPTKPKAPVVEATIQEATQIPKLTAPAPVGPLAKLKTIQQMPAEEIVRTDPILNLKRDVPVTDIHGVKTTIPEGEALTPYALKGNKFILQDDQTYVINKNQYENLKGQAVKAEAKPFAPELAQTTETVKSNSQGLAHWQVPADEPKYSQYTLPGGENYREILIQAQPERTVVGKTAGGATISLGDITKEFRGAHWDEPNVISHVRLDDRFLMPEPQEVTKTDPTTGKTYKAYQIGNISIPTTSSPDALIQFREANTKKVTFMEELQSDWAREARAKNPQFEITPVTNLPGRKWNVSRFNDFTDPGIVFDTKGEAQAYIDSHSEIPTSPLLKNWQELTVKRALKDAVDSGSDYFSWTNGAQQQARYNLSKQVDEIRWEPGKVNGAEGRVVYIRPTNQNMMAVLVDKSGKVAGTDGYAPSSWIGKNITDVIGKGIGEKIATKSKGSLSGEGLNIGGEWANALYDRQVKNIVEDVTGGKVEKIDLGLGTGRENNGWFTVNNKIVGNNQGAAGMRLPLKNDAIVPGQIVNNGTDWIVTKVGKNGKFNAIQDLTADNEEKIYTHILKRYVNSNGDVPSITEIANKLTPRDLSYLDNFSEPQSIDVNPLTQQAIKLTPEIKARIQGEAPKLKQPSGKNPLEQLKAIQQMMRQAPEQAVRKGAL